jgi:hypothetical protein
VLVAPVIVFVACWLTAGPVTAAEDPVQGVLPTVPGSEPAEQPPETTPTTAAPAPAPAPANEAPAPRSKTTGAKASAPTPPPPPVTADALVSPYPTAPVAARPVYRSSSFPYPPSAVIPASGGLSGQQGDDPPWAPILAIVGGVLAALVGAGRRLWLARSSPAQL